MAAPAVNAFNIPHVVIAAPPNATIDKANTYQMALSNAHLTLINVGIFLGLQNAIALPHIPVQPLAQLAQEQHKLRLIHKYRTLTFIKQLL